MRKAGFRDLDHVRLAGILTAIIAASVLMLGLAAIVAFERAVEPELVKRTRLIGSIFRSEIQRTLDLGIPFEVVAGLDRYLSHTLSTFNEVDRISVTNAAGATVAESRRPAAASFLERVGLDQAVGIERSTFSLPILAGNEVVGQIIVEVSPVFVETRLRGVFLDVLTIALIATLIAVELVVVVVVSSVGKPLDRLFRLAGEQRAGDFSHRVRPGGIAGLGRAAARLNDQAEDLATRMAALPADIHNRLKATGAWRVAQASPTRLRLSDFNDIRLALFMFSVATEVSSAFLPLYAKAAVRPAWLSPELAAAAPLALYLIAVAALSPFGAPLARRLGPRRLFLVAIPPTALALAAMALAETLLAISFWRGVIAIFYALATIACHQYAIRSAEREGGARPTGAFLGAVYGGVFCGSAVGGIVAGRFGFEAAFLTGAVIVALSGVLGRAMMLGTAGDPAVAHPPAQASTQRRKSPLRFLILLAAIAVPMNAATAIFIWYLTPLMLAAAGYGPGDIARVVMLYYLAVVVFGPTVARLCDRTFGPAVFIALGATASGLSLLLVGAWSGLWAIALGVAGLGLGHTLIRAPQYAYALQVMGGTEASLGALRLVERMGALAGLTLSATLLAQVGAQASLWTLGILVLTGSLAFIIIGGVRSR